jgi:hypothetical protein
MFSEINQMLRAGVPILVVAFAWIAVPATAFAHTVYDGDWSVLILRVAVLANRPFGMASRSLTEWSSTAAASPRCKDGSLEARL